MKVVAENKKARHNYFIEDTFEAGIVLEGSEVKSVRNGHMSLNESFATLKDGEVFLKNAYIKKYDSTSTFAPDERRNRKLLLNRREIEKISKMLEAKGYTLVPIKAYFKGSHIKLELGLGKGKKLYDKRNDQKEKTVKREILKSLKF